MKDPQLKNRIQLGTGNMLFEKLTSATRKRVFLSMTPLEVLPKTVIIQQGDTEASMFYVLETGACDALIANADGSNSKIVHQYKPGRHAPLSNAHTIK
jgi:CRP-like cAMP-binding protein